MFGPLGPLGPLGPPVGSLLFFTRTGINEQLPGCGDGGPPPPVAESMFVENPSLKNGRIFQRSLHPVDGFENENPGEKAEKPFTSSDRYVIPMIYDGVIAPSKRWLIQTVVSHTVDGRNPAPVDMENPPLLSRFYTSQVVQDFFHQQYF